MYSLNNNDSRVKVFFPAVKLTMTVVDVTDSARALEQNHQEGPAAGLVLGEALAGVALLGGELTQPGETVTLKMKVNGPVNGVLTEAATDGSLRGYTNQKRIPDFDSQYDINIDHVMGEKGSMEIIRSLPGKIISAASCEIQPVTVTEAIERYYAQSLQRMAVAEVCSQRSGASLEGARGILVECMPDGDEESFDRIRQLFDDDTAYNNLLDGSSTETICSSLGLSVSKIGKPEPLRFACTCSLPRVLDMLASLTVDDLQSMLSENKPTQIYCHMCGTYYEVLPADLKRILEEKERGEKKR